MCDHTPQQRGQTFEEMMGDTPIQFNPSTIDGIIEKLETSNVCVLCKGDARILSFAGGIKTVPCWLCKGTGERKLPALQVAFLLKVMKQRAAEVPQE